MSLRYAYYPGCSLESTGKPYNESIRATFKALEVELVEIDDWNCCGATMYMSSKKIVGYALSARNLAIAQKEGLDVCAPCSSCYTILSKANRQIEHDPDTKEKINDALSAANLSYNGQTKVRHPLDILVNDIGIDAIVKKSKYRLTGMKVAPYYGCQIVRPHGNFDDVDDPQTMDKLLAALGAEVTYYPPKVRCCGGMLMMTDENIALKLCHELIEAAEVNGANVIATACPLCEMNLEAYQPQINKGFNTQFNMPILYFSQLLGMALGIAPVELGIERMIVPAPKVTLTAKAEAL